MSANLLADWTECLLCARRVLRVGARVCMRRGSEGRVTALEFKSYLCTGTLGAYKGSALLGVPIFSSVQWG